MKKIAIFHNLNPGGGLNIIKSIVPILSKRGILIDIYSHKKLPINGSNKNYYYPIKTTKNSIQQLIQTFFELNKVQKQISEKIVNKSYDYIFVFPCNIIQSPHILKYLPSKKTYYFFLEPKREFYEKSSFDYYTPKRILSRLIRYPIKILDIINCKSTRNIIADSIYTKNNLKKIYNKKSIVVYPGMKFIKPEKITIKNNNKFLSLSILTMLKGHHISAQLVPKIEIYGEMSHENIRKYIPKNISINTKIDQKDKNNIYKRFSFFLANQIKEPFGLTTLEAITNNCYVFGSNESGTSEIINSNVNGILLPINNLELSKKIINFISHKKTITFQKTCIINWNNTVNQILKIIQNE